MKLSSIISVKCLLLVCFFIIYIDCSEKVNNHVKIHKAVPLAKPTYDAEKYSLVDTSKTYEQLRIQACQTKNVEERIQLFDYLLACNPKKADIGEFFKHFNMSGRSDLRESREVDLINATVNQNEYMVIKEQCICYLIFFYVEQAQLDSVLVWMDRLHNLYPKSDLFIGGRYNIVSDISTKIAQINADKELREPERLWLLGYSYWRLASAEFKSPFYPFLLKTRLYFDSLKYRYPKSSFNANAAFIDNIDTGDEGDDRDTLFDPASVNKQMDLLKKYPRTTARDEILLRYAGYHYCKAEWLVHKNQDSALYYLSKTDSLIGTIDPSKLFLEYSSQWYYNLIASTNKMLKELEKK